MIPAINRCSFGIPDWQSPRKLLQNLAQLIARCRRKRKQLSIVETRIWTARKTSLDPVTWEGNWSNIWSLPVWLKTESGKCATLENCSISIVRRCLAQLFVHQEVQTEPPCNDTPANLGASTQVSRQGSGAWNWIFVCFLQCFMRKGYTDNEHKTTTNNTWRLFAPKTSHCHHNWQRRPIPVSNRKHQEGVSGRLRGIKTPKLEAVLKNPRGP